MCFYYTSFRGLTMKLSKEQCNQLLKEAEFFFIPTKGHFKKEKNDVYSLDDFFLPDETLEFFIFKSSGGILLKGMKENKTVLIALVIK